MARKEHEDPEGGLDEELRLYGLSGLSGRFRPVIDAEGKRRPEVDPPMIYSCNYCPDWKAPLGKELWEVLKDGVFTRHNHDMHDGHASLVRIPLHAPGPPRMDHSESDQQE